MFMFLLTRESCSALLCWARKLPCEIYYTGVVKWKWKKRQDGYHAVKENTTVLCFSPRILHTLYPHSIYKTAVYFISILRGFKMSDDAFRLSYSIAFICSIRPFLNLFHLWLYIFHLSRFSGDSLIFSFLQVSRESWFLVVALGPFSWHGHTK
jgi:hypothetical protein